MISRRHVRFHRAVTKKKRGGRGIGTQGCGEKGKGKRGRERKRKKTVVKHRTSKREQTSEKIRFLIVLLRYINKEQSLRDCEMNKTSQHYVARFRDKHRSSKLLQQKRMADTTQRNIRLIFSKCKITKLFEKGKKRKKPVETPALKLAMFSQRSIYDHLKARNVQVFFLSSTSEKPSRYSQLR